MTYARKKRRNIIFMTKRKEKIWKYQKILLSLHSFLKRRYKELQNYEGEVDKYRE